MAARTTSIRSIGVAAEVFSFANVDLLTGIPSPGGLTFVTASGLQRGDLTTIGDSFQNENDGQVRDGPYEYAPEVATMWSGGSRVRRRRGTISLTFNEVQLLGDGSGLISTYPGHPLYMLLHSGMKVAAPGVASDVVAAGVDANNFTSTGLGGLYDVGGIFSTTLNGRAEYSAVTARSATVAPGQITHSPAMSQALTNETLRFAHSFYQGPELDLDAFSSVTLRIDGVGFRTYAYGCRMTEAAFTVVNDRVQCVITLQAAYIDDDHPSADVQEPEIPNGAAQHLRGSYVVISDTAVPAQGAATPYALGREVVQPMTDTFSFSITNTYQDEGHSDDIVGMSDWCLVNSVMQVDGTLSVPTTTLDDDNLDRNYRSLLIGFAPQGVGDGLALYVPAALARVDGSKRDTSGDTVMFTGSWGAGPWRGAVTDGGVTDDPVNAPWVLGLGL